MSVIFTDCVPRRIRLSLFTTKGPVKIISGIKNISPPVPLVWIALYTVGKAVSCFFFSLKTHKKKRFFYHPLPKPN